MNEFEATESTTILLSINEWRVSARFVECAVILSRYTVYSSFRHGSCNIFFPCFLSENVNVMCSGCSIDCYRCHWAVVRFLHLNFLCCYQFPYRFHDLQTQMKPNPFEEIDFTRTNNEHRCVHSGLMNSGCIASIVLCSTFIRLCTLVMHLINHDLMLHKFIQVNQCTHNTLFRMHNRPMQLTHCAIFLSFLFFLLFVVCLFHSTLMQIRSCERLNCCSNEPLLAEYGMHA